VVPTGVEATGAVSQLLVWGPVDTSQTPDWTIISDSQTPNWEEVA